MIESLTVTNTTEAQTVTMTFTEQFPGECGAVVEALDRSAIDRLVSLLAETRAAAGRLFILGVGAARGTRRMRSTIFARSWGLRRTRPPIMFPN
jgi:hypothetical protein